MHRAILLTNLARFTKYVFKAQNGYDYDMAAHHQQICDTLMDVVKGRTKRLIINIAPRYGKTLLVSRMFIAFGLALNPKSNFLLLSYSQTLTEENSAAIKDILNTEYYRAVFDTRIRHGENSKIKWKTQQGGGVYATTPLGQVTGFGAGLYKSDTAIIDEFAQRYNPADFGGAIVIDDPLKPDDAISDTIRESVNLRFESTIRSRVNNRDVPIIIIMQRLHEHDLCGYLQEIEPDEWRVLSLPCINYDENGEPTALWERRQSLSDLEKLRNANNIVFETQYMQNPKPLEGLMYREFKTYQQLPYENGIMKNYTDTADTGRDYLCSICYYETRTAIYVTDVLFTQKPMEVTEPEMAQMLMRNKVALCVIESNNAGRIFRRNVERISRENRNLKTEFRDSTTRENKEVKIFNNANEVNNLIYMPEYWTQWRDFYTQITSFRRVGRNAHDDAPDCLSEMVKGFDGGGYQRVTDEEIEADFF